MCFKLSRKLDETRTQHIFSSDDPQAYYQYQQQYFAVIGEILGELSSRFSQPAMKTLEFIETIILDAANDRLQSLSTDSAAPVETLSMYGNIIDFQKLDSQLRMLPSVIATVNDQMSQRDTSYLPVKQVSSVRFVTEILTLSSFAKNLCSEVYIYASYLTVPMTSATAERSFLTMRRITRSSAIAERPRCRAYSYFYYSFETILINCFPTVTAAVIPVNCGNATLKREGLLSPQKFTLNGASPMDHLCNVI